MFLATVAFVASVGIPLIDAWTNITNKKMKGINDTTVTCYVNPSMLFVMGVIIQAKGLSHATFKLLKEESNLVDFLLYASFGTATML